MPAGTNVASGVLVSPGGQQGIPGPNAVSTDTGNQATFGSDNRIYVPDPTPVITSVRLRSFNAIGNPNFEVDQRNIHGSSTYPAGSINQFQCDRWSIVKAAATGVINAASGTLSTPLKLPGTNFYITTNFLQLVVTTPQATLAAGEYVQIFQYVEGPLLRELLGDVHSVSLLCQCSIPSFNFSLTIKSLGGTYSLALPCTTSLTSNGLTLITLPNLPVFTPSATWNLSPGNIGCTLVICLGVGTTYQAPSTGSWVAGNFVGYAGQPNFLATNNAAFTLWFVQHEPGAFATTLIDKPFTQNYDECLRYYQKSYNYATALGTVASYGRANAILAGAYLTNLLPSNNFPKPMAKTLPVVTVYSDQSGAVNNMRNNRSGADQAVSGTIGAEKSIQQINLSVAATAGDLMTFHYTADTAW